MSMDFWKLDSLRQQKGANMKGGDVVVGIHFHLGFHRGIPILLFFVSSAYIIYKDLIPRNSSLDNNRNSFTNELLSVFSKCEEELEKKML